MSAYMEVRRVNPCYLYDKFEAWKEHTGILSGDGLTWIAIIPCAIIVYAISIIYWLIVKEK